MKSSERNNLPVLPVVNISTPAARGIDLLIRNHEKFFILILCIIAGLRVFFFSAAFPFFSIIDEQYHYDLVVKYSRGNWPNLQNLRFDEKTIDWVVYYCSPEYLSRNPDIPIWSMPDSQISFYVSQGRYYVSQKTNLQSFSPPVYYLLAAGWLNTGKFLGVKDGDLLYWIRFMNIVIFIVLILLSWRFCKELAPENHVLHTGVPLLLTFFPQDVFFCINNDVLSPLFFLLLLYLMNRIYRGTGNTWIYYSLTGLVAACTYLTKLSNLPVIVVLIIFALLHMRHLYKEKHLRQRFPHMACLIFAAVIPILCWHLWNYRCIGDWTGTSLKIQILGWERKPLELIWDHPFFTPKGLAYFLTTLTESFWRGELVWKQQLLSWHSMDLFYVISSVVFLAVAIIKSLKFRKNAMSTWSNFGIILVFVSFMAILSIIYDFGDCYYPSRNAPYLVSGRLISAAIVPFLILYVEGGLWLTKKIHSLVGQHTIILAIGLLITLSEIIMTLPVTGSLYNWFHLP